ncbi:hypothetical protein ACFPFX_29620 [Streptomyces mauvecolor]|uniref:Uncharacterized protein n=1 Tax=Streptomyces mauvecolor TaxID=58345 RepID=A0ABV9UVK3_9ACTN
MTAEVHPYVTQVGELWREFYGPEPEARADDPGMIVDRATRKAWVLKTLTGALPATTRLYCGHLPSGLDAYLGSEHWHGRRARKGSLFPDATSTVTTFAAFLEETWLSAAEPWAARIVRYEFDILWGTPAKPTAAALERGLRLPDGAWAADCRYDVPDYALRLRETCADCPWPVAVQHTRPRGRPFATLTLRAGKGLRRIHLRDATCEALRPLWDEEADWPTGHEGVLAQAERRELVVPCAP